MTFTCVAVATGPIGRRWKCTDDTGRSWYAGVDYRYNGKLASEAYVPPTTSTPTTKKLAPNGVLQIYENDPRVPIWVQGFDNWKERTARIGTVSGTGADTVVTLSDQVRYGVKCKVGAGDGSTDLGEALARGYQDSPADWGSIEQTGAVEVTQKSSNDSDQDVTWFGPSGRHTGSGPPTGCMGSCYKASLHGVKGSNRLAFENWHVSYAYIPWKSTLADVVKRMSDGSKVRVLWKWVKMIVKTPTETYARCEIWINTKPVAYGEKPSNEFQLVRVLEDHNDWPGSTGMDDCGCAKSDQAMVWRAPSVVFRTDNQTMKVSLASVQEIKTPTTFYKEGDIVSLTGQNTTPSPSPTPTPEPTPTPIPTTGKVLWTSKGKFDDGKPLTLKSEGLAYNGTLQIKNDEAFIDGKGTIILKNTRADDPGGNRMYIKVPNYNVQVDCDVVLDPASDDVNIKTRSNHHFFNGCGFGGYSHDFQFQDKQTTFKKEPVHGIYSDRIAEKDCPLLEYNKKVGLRARLYDGEGGVVQESWVKKGGIDSSEQWQMFSRWVDKGDAPEVLPLDDDDKNAFAKCIAKGPGDFAKGEENKLKDPYKKPGAQVWIRSNSAVDGVSIKSTQVSNITITEI